MSRRHLFRIQAALILIPVLVTGTFATTLTRQINLVDLVGESQLILHGTVKSVADGIDERGIPYTQVTVRVF